MLFHNVFRISEGTPDWKKKSVLSLSVNLTCDALQQNREQVANANFEEWTFEVGIAVKNNSFVDFEIFVFYTLMSSMTSM